MAFVRHCAAHARQNELAPYLEADHVYALVLDDSDNPVLRTSEEVEAFAREHGRQELVQTEFARYGEKDYYESVINWTSVRASATRASTLRGMTRRVRAPPMVLALGGCQRRDLA